MKTSLSLKLVPWKIYGRDHHRILVRQDPKLDEDLVKKIQVRGLDNGVHLSASQIKKILDKLWQPESPGN